jgi:hypothetical protein
VIDDDPDFVGLFVQMWAEAVIRKVDRVRELRAKEDGDLQSDDRQVEWSPTDDYFQRTFRVRWTEEHMVVWAFYQLERWARRFAIERGETPSPLDERLTAVRNACAGGGLSCHRLVHGRWPWSVPKGGSSRADIGAGLPRTVLVGLPDSALYQA